ncbi:MAG: CYTH and CHAD domain-containing protein [Actinomycetota bacterium]|nr:CYTH and CHAD domain-containing protein [Actinomycetota bacterium]
MERHREQEHKFDVQDGFSFAALGPPLARLGVHAEAAQHAMLRATYFDSADLRLLRADITLRRRVGGPDEGWHLKLPAGGPGERMELRLPLSAGTAVPPELAKLMTAYLRGARLRPVLTLDTDRQATRISAEGGEALVEVAEDRVVAERLGDHQVRAWREVEVERLGDEGKVARALERLLAGAGARPAAAASKAARALDVAPPADDKARRDLLAARLHALVAMLAEQDVRVRQRAPEAIHDFRVALRRTRSALRTFAPLLDEPAVAGLRAELGWLNEALGAARDAEVLAARARADLGERLDEAHLATVAADLLSTLEAEASTARARLEEVLDSTRYCEALESLARFAAAPRYRPGRAASPRRLRRCVAKEIERVAVTVRSALASDGPEAEAAFHSARKRAKRVRYGAEVLAAVDHKAATRLAAAFTAVQDVLGERHDAVVAHDRYRAEALRAGQRAGHAFAFGVLAERERSAMAAAAERFPTVWAKASTPKQRRFLSS